jgi:hypothetical protein
LDFLYQGKVLNTVKLEKATRPPTIETQWPNDVWLTAEAPPLPDNEEMAKMFFEDQSPRLSDPPDWEAMAKGDALRRQRTREMLEAGLLRTARDYYHAAFIFQHSDKADDYLLAHTLALLSIAGGQREATWIAAATLDRYQQSTKHPQIYGTQYLRDRDGNWTLQPMKDEVISDRLRILLGVPDKAGQHSRLETFKAEDKPPSK